jgi:hypothetical protein
MAYEISPYNEEATVFEVLNDGTPEFYGTEEECQAYIDSLAE